MASVYFVNVSRDDLNQCGIVYPGRTLNSGER